MNEILELLPHLDNLLKAAVQRAREIYSLGTDKQQDDFRGLYIGEQDIDSLLERHQSVGTPESAAELLHACGQLPGIEAISRHFGFTPFDHGVLLLTFAPEVDLRYERIYAYLQDDVSKRRPSVDLALNLLAVGASARLESRERFVSGSPLLQSGLLRLVAEVGKEEQSLLGQYLKLDDAAVGLLIGSSGLDPRLVGCCSFEPKVSSPEPTTDLLRRIPSYVAATRMRGGLVRMHFAGHTTSCMYEAARAVAGALDAPLLSVNLSRRAGWGSEAATLSMLIGRESLQSSAVVVLDGVNEDGDSSALKALIEGMQQSVGVLIVISEYAPACAELKALRFLTIDFPAADYAERRLLWQTEVAKAGLYASPSLISTLASRFTHGFEEIHTAVEVARLNLDWQATANERPSPDEVVRQLMQAARAQSGGELAALTSKLRPVYQWADLVLPQDVLEQLNEICLRVAHSHDVLVAGGFGSRLSGGKGVAVLFAGASGTGKTMAAEVIADRLGLDLFRVDLSTVVSKYIGETEKNLEKIFNAAVRSSSVLLFDEGDALFGKRSDVSSANDRYANIEVSYLLQKMDQYEGITILTTNLRGNLDEAFVRRLACTVHFPFPAEADRLKIWQQIWPSETKVDPEVKFEALAKHYKLSGGNIKNIALATAYLAAAAGRPVRMSDILHATRREYEKVGKVMSAEEMEIAIH